MKKKENKVLLKAKQQHFDFLKKNNAITDAKNGELSLGAMKALDVILQVYQEKQDNHIQLELAYLRKKLGLQRNNDYVDRIKNYLLELKLPFELRDFNDVKSGKDVAWVITSFLNDVKSYKDTQHIIEINISNSFVDYMIEQAGYTKIDLALSTKFKTKYGYKIYEMYLRYYSMPNRYDKSIGVIKKDINELNEKFGTRHKHASKLMEGINRGVAEIFKLTDEEIISFYNKTENKFVFSWEKKVEKIEHYSIIPVNRVDELIDWILIHTPQKINDVPRYRTKLKQLILTNSYQELESTYRGLLSQKYELNRNQINALKTKEGRYRDFKKEN
ncbi:MAG: replication initiation protein [Epsilonproteobacteria bacterium]|nr:replication initiation protein [Campylobacterota bacterium]